MLSDSKVRQAGFIRNSSSRKIVYHPEPPKQSRDYSDDDSFSSFQYQGPCRISVSSKEKAPVLLNQRDKQKQLIITREIRPPTAKIPPKPTKKQQPEFQNQRLKNNFFQQPINQPIAPPRSKQKPQYHQQTIPASIPRSLTPQFSDSDNILNHKVEEVQNICNRLGNMKVLEGNFSFNPKVNKPKKEVDLKEQIYLAENNLNPGERVKDNGKKSKVNNYFSQAQNNKFQYDFQSSDESQQEEQQNHQNSFSQGQSQNMDNEMMMYYRQQQRQRTLPEAARKQRLETKKQKQRRQPQKQEQKRPQQGKKIKTKTQSRNKNPQAANQTYSQGQIYNPRQNNNSKNQNLQYQQFENNQQEELITDYNKTDFGIGVVQQLKRNNKSKQSKTAQLQQQNVIQTHGGISFEVDVKQFSHTPQMVSYQPVRTSYQQKKKKVNQKEEMLKRREMAKIYSKQARFRLFGFS